MSNFQASEDEAMVVCRRLLEKGADIKRVNASGDTTLLKAVKNGDIKRVKQILDYKTDGINMPDNDGNTPLMIATSMGYYAIANLLLDRGADVNIVNKNGEDALMRLKYHGIKLSLPTCKIAAESINNLGNSNTKISKCKLK